MTDLAEIKSVLARRKAAQIAEGEGTCWFDDHIEFLLALLSTGQNAELDRPKPKTCNHWVKSGFSGYKCTLGERLHDVAECVVEDCPNRSSALSTGQPEVGREEIATILGKNIEAKITRYDSEDHAEVCVVGIDKATTDLLSTYHMQRRV